MTYLRADGHNHLWLSDMVVISRKVEITFTAANYVISRYCYMTMKCVIRHSVTPSMGLQSIPDYINVIVK